MTDLTQEEKSAIETIATFRQRDTVTIASGLAVICGACNTVSDSTGHECPACGRGPLVNLARLLDRQSERDRAIGIVNELLARGHGSKQRGRIVAAIAEEGQ